MCKSQAPEATSTLSRGKSQAPEVTSTQSRGKFQAPEVTTISDQSRGKSQPPEVINNPAQPLVISLPPEILNDSIQPRRDKRRANGSESCNSSGTCSVCFKVFHLLKEKGSVYPHGRGGKRFTGSHQPPLLQSVSSQPISSSFNSTTSCGNNDTSFSTGVPRLLPQQLQVPVEVHATFQNIPRISLQHPILSSQTIKHIPKAARLECAKTLANILKKISSNPFNITDWSLLLNYGKEVLIAPPRAGKRVSLPSIIKKRNACYLNNNGEMSQNNKVTKDRPKREKTDLISSIVW